MQAETICDELGITLSSAANIFFRQLVRAGGIPFEMRDPFYSSQNQEYLQASIDEYEANKETGIVKTLEKGRDFLALSLFRMLWKIHIFFTVLHRESIIIMDIPTD